MDSVRNMLRNAGAGRFLYHLFHRPIAILSQCYREGGPLAQWRTARGRNAMEKAAATLTPLTPSAAGLPLELHLLTGRRFWYQTAFCLWTFAQHAKRPIAPRLYDDGSLEPSHVETLRRVFPSAHIISHAELLARLDEALPTARFPVLRERRLHYPNIRKLTDVHSGGVGWKLVIDSDLLFFRRPAVLIDWLDRPQSPLHAVDVTTSYGYAPALLESLTHAPLPDRLNVGLCGLASGEIDWERIEFWCRTLIEKAGTHYYLEQALVALLLANRKCTVAPPEDYVTLPPPPEAMACRAVMHHYVAGSKADYFQHNWRQALAAAGATAASLPHANTLSY